MSVLLQTLQQNFGYNAFRGGQEKAIQSLLDGRSAAAIFPTGSGKSLIYQLAALHLPHLTLVVSPLLALISDQLEAMQRFGIPAARIDSTQKPQEVQQIREDIRKGRTKVLMVSVERFKNEGFRRFLSELPISLLVVDEAHCISEWGHNFRPDYLKLPEYKRDFSMERVLLLTATATPRVIEDMCRRFDIAREDVVLTGFYRPNLHLEVRAVAEDQKMEELVQVLEPDAGRSAIVYVTLQKTAETVAAGLRERGVVAAAYHAGMNSVDRASIQSAFMYGQVPVIVATIAFGMGIDKPDIRCVVHYDLPKSLEGYSQEIGRAGRDGETSRCVLLGNLDGLAVLENFVYGDTPEAAAIAKVLRDIQAAGQRFEFQLTDLSTRSDIRQLPLKTLMVYLEMDGLVRPLYSYFAHYRFKLNRTPEQIAAAFGGERGRFIEAVFAHSKRARLWWTVDFEAITAHYPCERKRIVAALDYLNDQGALQLEFSGMTEVYEVLQPGFDLESVAQGLHRRFADKEAAEVARIAEMLDFFGSSSCLSKRLSAYFGEDTGWTRCESCSVCRHGGVQLRRTRELPPLSRQMVADALVDLQEVLPEEKRTPVLQARFLCALHTPVFTQLKAARLKGYGVLEHYRFQEVLQVLTDSGA